MIPNEKFHFRVSERFIGAFLMNEYINSELNFQLAKYRSYVIKKSGCKCILDHEFRLVENVTRC